MLAIGYLIALGVSFWLTHLWYRLSPAKGSGWAIFGAVAVPVALVAGEAASLTGDILVSGIGALGYFVVWNRVRGTRYAGWLLFVAILLTISLLNDLT